MNISNSQVNRLRHFVRAGLRSLFRPEPQTAVEWADANYYLPKESAYQEGRWETLPFQRAIMNAMGSDYIREVNVVKSARVGYSKMLLGVYAYFIEHKQRNTLIWLPTDGDAENFMKTHVEPTIRDIPSLLALAPWYGKKHRDNTLTMKRFTNGRGFWCLGGKAAKNYREKSVDVAGYDELAAFDDDIEQEGSPTFLGDKRIEGSVWPKSIRGSTPKVRGTCQIERAASESPHFMRFHVACPHCGEEQYLKFGDKETPFGLKWTPDDPSSVFYLCEHNACVIRQQELDFTDARYICEKTGIWTRDGILWFSSSGEEIEPPDSVTFHIWTAYSPFTTWVQIVKDWMKTKGDIAPPDIPAGFVAVFNSDEASWHLVEDHRGKTVYDVASGDALFISELGPLPENVTWLSPEGEFQKWNGTAWVKDTEAEKLFRIREAEETKNNLMQVASEHIAPLQDAADLEIATEEETSLLEAWKKYRVLLNRVDTSTAPDIEWPTNPVRE